MKQQGSDKSSPAATAPRGALFEPLALLLLSLATIGTAWCFFQAAAWGGVPQQVMNLSAACSQAVTDQLQSYQLALVDVLLASALFCGGPLRSFKHSGYAGRFSRWVWSPSFSRSNACCYFQFRGDPRYWTKI